MADITVTTTTVALAEFSTSRRRLVVQNLSATVAFVNILGTDGDPDASDGLALPQYGMIQLTEADARSKVTASTASGSATVRVVGV